MGASTPWTTKGKRPCEQQTLWGLGLGLSGLCSPALPCRHKGQLVLWGHAWLLLFPVAVGCVYLFTDLFCQPNSALLTGPGLPLGPSTCRPAVHREIISCRGVRSRCRADIFPFLVSNSAVFLPPSKLPAACCLPLAAAYLVGPSSPLRSRANAWVLTSACNGPPFFPINPFILFIPF